MPQESFNRQSHLPADAPPGSGHAPGWARDYAPRRADALALELPEQVKAGNGQVPLIDSQQVALMHARGRLSNWMTDQVSRNMQYDWYPGYGPGHGYYYPVNHAPGGGAEQVAPVQMPPVAGNAFQFGNSINPYYNYNFNAFPGQDGGNNSIYNSSNPFYNNGFNSSIYNSSNPFYNNGFNSSIYNSSNPFYNNGFNNSIYNSGNPFYNNGFNSSIYNSGNPFYNNGFNYGLYNSGNPFYNNGFNYGLYNSGNPFFNYGFNSGIYNSIAYPF